MTTHFETSACEHLTSYASYSTHQAAPDFNSEPVSYHHRYFLSEKTGVQSWLLVSSRVCLPSSSVHTHAVAWSGLSLSVSLGLSPDFLGKYLSQRHSDLSRVK